MKQLMERYNEAQEKANQYARAPRAGWMEAGRRTKDNQAILVRRREVTQLADDLAQALYGQEIFLREFFELRAMMEQLAQGTADSKRCPRCHRLFRTGWMEGKCPYCQAAEEAGRIVAEKIKGGVCGAGC